MRRFRTNRVTAFLAGAALFLGAAPLFTSALSGQTKTQSSSSSPAAKSTTSPAKKSPTKSSSKKRSSRRTVRRQTAPTKDRYIEIQSALAKAGHYDGEPNGKWDAKSVAAMKAFQEKNGLRATGKLDALSLQKLGLGSETAGLAAPRTPSAGTRASQPPR